MRKYLCFGWRRSYFRWWWSIHSGWPTRSMHWRWFWRRGGLSLCYLILWVCLSVSFGASRSKSTASWVRPCPRLFLGFLRCIYLIFCGIDRATSLIWWRSWCRLCHCASSIKIIINLKFHKTIKLEIPSLIAYSRLILLTKSLFWDVLIPYNTNICYLNLLIIQLFDRVFYLSS